jgi:hypothetical protein
VPAQQWVTAVWPIAATSKMHAMSRAENEHDTHRTEPEDLGAEVAQAADHVGRDHGLKYALNRLLSIPMSLPGTSRHVASPHDFGR